MGMRVVHERCAGLDVHKKTVVACTITPTGREVRTFGTTTAELFELAEWLAAQGCLDVAMESTGVYWKPVYNVLESLDFRPEVANARHIKAVPGRKTDVRDAEWIAELHAHGLLPRSFIPAKAQRELRELVRYRRALVQERSREAARLQKVLEGANIKLASVASDVLGCSGRSMLQGLVEGIDDPQQLAQRARGQLKNKHAALAQALHGVVGAHQRLLLREQLSHISELEERIARLDQEVQQRLHPFEQDLKRLDGIPGIGPRSAQDIVAEIGTDMNRFPSSRHLASWAKICPSNNLTAGKQRGGRIGPGNRWLRTTLTEAAHAAGRTKNSYHGAQYRHLCRRLGRKRAAVAVGHSLLTGIYYILKDHVPYRDLGPSYIDERSRESTQRALVKRLHNLDFDVTVTDRRTA